MISKAKIGETLDRNKFLQRLYRMNFAKVMEAKIIWEFLEPKRGEVIGNIACGTAVQSIELARKGCRVYSIDRNKHALETAKSIAGGYDCNFQLGDAENLPYMSNALDKVICVCALEHFENDEKSLAEMNRVLKGGGTLVLTVDSFTLKGIKDSLKEKHKNWYGVVNYYSLPQLRHKLENAGFDVEKSKYFINSPLSAFFFSIILKIRLRYPSALIFPIAYILSSVSDRLWANTNEGYLLAVKAKKRLNIPPQL